MTAARFTAIPSVLVVLARENVIARLQIEVEITILDEFARWGV